MEKNRGGFARLRTTPRRQPFSQAQSSISSPQPPATAAEHPWTTSDVDQLVELIAARASVLLGPVDGTSKRVAWEEVSQRLKRADDEVRRKWSGIVADLRQGKRSTPFKPYELAALKALGAAERPGERSRPPMSQASQEPLQLQIVPTSVRSITTDTFLQQENTARRSLTPTMTSVSSSVGINTAAAGLTIVALNREVSITPVKPPQPPPSNSRDSSEELQVLRFCNSVHTQTPTEHDEPSAKKARHGSSSQADTTSLLQRLVCLEERRVALQQEQLSVDREKVKCVRDLLAVLGKNDKTAPVPNGDLVAAVVSSAL
ncbi:uncharacterized protein LOC142557730 [Dermacentor variabilis]|uniref:uncharacterized protein LOC142557730 n=1 Tax=Dermacentor variabilis TaxID=34621 RepID=UPI003F5C6520